MSELPVSELPVSGVALATVAAGIKRVGQDDLVLISLPAGSTSAAVFTRNAFAAAPVLICRDHLQSSQGDVRALLINSGNANAGTGQPGLAMAEAHCQVVAAALGIEARQVLPFSTGVIGQLLPDETMQRGIVTAVGQLGAAVDELGAANDKLGEEGHVEITSAAAWERAARGIMTTDTVPKLVSRQFKLGSDLVTVTGMAKGSGMIQPDMATMLAYVFTDARVSKEALQSLLEHAMERSFNAITVDSDTSTNDACVLSATGSGLALSPGQGGWQAFSTAVHEVCLELAQAIVRDGEGATKFITIKVDAGQSIQECRQIAYAIANSPLVKTACFASDANVGRLLMAVGKAGIESLDAAAVRVYIGAVLAFDNGGIAEGYTEAKGAAEMSQSDITFRVELGRGDASATVYTSDLSHDYVSINADYRS